MKFPEPYKMTPEEFRDILKKAMNKIENGKPLNIDTPVTFDTNALRDDFREGVIVYHVLSSVLDDLREFLKGDKEKRAFPIPFVDNGLSEAPSLTIGRVDQARKKFGKDGKPASVRVACEMILNGKFPENPRPKQSNKDADWTAVKQQYYEAKRKQKEINAQFAKDVKACAPRIRKDLQNTEAEAAVRRSSVSRKLT